tara:strand:- start:252 stop:923 length:672 start_codon:yes stop_codon:yes gene_type:complete
MIDFTPDTKLNESQIHDLFSSEDDAVFCDIGARTGEFSIPRAKLCKKVYAFEPSSFNFPNLKKSSAQFGDRYECFNVAFSDKDYDCVTRFKDCTTDQSEQKIKYRQIRSFFIEHDLDTPTYVKIDVEGMESTILKTMNFLFEKRVPIYCEVHHISDTWDCMDYKDNPSFKKPKDGGFDFNILKEYEYKVYQHIRTHDSSTMRFITKDQDYNPPDPSHWGMLLV